MKGPAGGKIEHDARGLGESAHEPRRKGLRRPFERLFARPVRRHTAASVDVRSEPERTRVSFRISRSRG